MADKIIIISCPGPDRSISEKSIENKDFLSKVYRNRRIGEFLKELKLTEGRNTGIPKIKRALKNNRSKEPEFETNETRDYFMTTIYMHENFTKDEIYKIKTSDKILKYLDINEYITTAIAKDILKLSAPRTRVILAEMVKNDLIISEGANRNKKYRLK